MQIFSNKIGLIHFVGIGGIGMSGIAEVLINLEFKVTGSDITENQNVKRLKQLGIKIYIGHNRKNILNASILVVSSAIKNNNQELIEARKKRILYSACFACLLN